MNNQPHIQPQPNPPDAFGRIIMHCEQGLSLTKASMTRFIMHCLQNDIEILQTWAFNKNFRGSLVCVVVRIRPDQVEEFEIKTGGKLRLPVQVHIN
jgi:hypothetical protein